MKILLAEDDRNIATVVQLALEHIGKHEVEIAGDGEQALNMAMSGDFDLILLDGMMPKMGGVKVCQEFQKRSAKKTPVIFLSAKSQQSDINEFLACGIGYIQKPFSPSGICEMIDSLLEQQREQVS